MGNIKIFENETLGQIRTTTIDDQPYFVGKDVTDILGYSNSRDALAKHVDSDDKADVAIYDGSQNRNMTVINESGLYSLVIGSKLPSAKEFKRWVTSEVLPSIRANGGYIAGQEDMDDMALLAKSHEIALRILAEREHRLKEVETQNKRLAEVNAIQAQQIEDMQPKSAYYDIILSCKNAVETRVIARDYGWSAQQLNMYLHNKRVQYKTNSGVWLLYQDLADKGYTKIHTSYVQNGFGGVYAKENTRWTQKGREFIYKLLKKDGILPIIEQDEEEFDIEDIF